MIQERENKAQRRAKREIYSALEVVQKELKLSGKISKRGVPYLIGELPNGRKYSVCYFRRHHGYTVFFPYGEWSEQEKHHVRDVVGIELVVEHLIEEHCGQEAADGP